MKSEEFPKEIRSAAQLAAILEVSGWPKPGNVHRSRDHPDTRYEHFLAGSIAIGSSVEDSAMRGLLVAQGKIDVGEIGIGSLIRKAVRDVAKSHRNGNTHLGVCLLLIPLAAAAAKTKDEFNEVKPLPLRNNFRKLMEMTTAADTISVYEAIALASSKKDLGIAQGKLSPDLYELDAKKRILKVRISLLTAMKESSSYDTVAYELAHGLEISFNVGYTTLIETFEICNDINIAIVHTFLRILSEFPDTFIARKIGLKKVSDIEDAVEIGIKETCWISEIAKKILDKGGLKTEIGETMLWNLEKKLYKMGKEYNPGTTADLTVSSLMIALLDGLRF